MNRFVAGLAAAALLLGAPIAASAYPIFEYPIGVGNACAWHIIGSPNKTTSGTNYQNVLFAVEATSSTDAWADGYYATTAAHSLLEHWNGAAWSIVAAPTPPHASSAALNGIGASSATDVWAIGTYFDTTANQNHTLIMHYNGSTWSLVASPNVGNANNFIRGISAISTNDAWAVGQSVDLTSGNTSPLTLHWNGSVWSIVPSYNVGQPFSGLVGVAAFSPTNVYTLGNWAADQGGNILRPQGAHYHGSWTLQNTPFMGSASSPLNAQAAISGNNIWGVGDWYDGSAFQSLAEHWNGSSWTIVPSPDNGGSEGSGDPTILFGAAAVNSNDVWGTGVYYDGTRSQTFTMQWSGSSWAIVPSPNFGGANVYYNQLNGASKVPGTTNVWAVGLHGAGASSNNTVPSKTLILEFHC